LRTHHWIVERVLLPIARGEPPAAADLRPTGRLVCRLVRVVPPGEFDLWKTWIRLTIGDLQSALVWPADRRTEAWVRWLFHIPYSVPVTRRRPSEVARTSLTMLIATFSIAGCAKTPIVASAAVPAPSAA